MDANVPRQANIYTGMSLVDMSAASADEVNREGSNLRFCIRSGPVTFKTSALIYPQSSVSGDENVSNPGISQMSVETGKHRPKIGNKSISREFLTPFGGICTPYAPVEDKAYVSVRVT
jgi:hypothetical protein